MFAEKNSIYLIAGYVVFLGGIGIYLLSLVLRQRNLKRDQEMLEQISDQLKQQDTQATEEPQADSMAHKGN
jgi:hypothetical protein